jgi:hypothetical protein
MVVSAVVVLDKSYDIELFVVNDKLLPFVVDLFVQIPVV